MTEDQSSPSRRVGVEDIIYEMSGCNRSIGGGERKNSAHSDSKEFRIPLS